MLPLARYRNDVKTGEESDMEEALILSAQGVAEDVRETIERCKQSVFGKVRNYCEALEDLYSVGQGNRSAVTDEKYEYLEKNKALLNPGVAGLDISNKDGSPLLIKTDSDLGITRKFWFNADLDDNEKVETEDLMNNYLALVHYIVARGSGQEDENIDFYTVDGHYDVYGNFKVLKGIQKYWCDVLGDVDREYIIELFYGNRDSEVGLASIKESISQDFGCRR